MDLLARDSHAWIVGCRVRKVAGAGRTEEGDVRFGDVLCAWVLCLLSRNCNSSTVVDLLRLWRDRRHWPGTRIYLASFDANQVVPGPPRARYRNGHYGIWRRSNDWFSARDQTDGSLPFLE